VATWNGFRLPPSSRGYHSLERMVEIAREVGGDGHGFHFIQLPFNELMPEGAAVIEMAQRLGVTVITSASLMQGRIPPRRAIEFVRSQPGITTALIGMSRVEHVEENLAAADLRNERRSEQSRV
jgi:aryl-alcohol dehydrogenase-like predicted oxidoreductase